MKLKLCLKFNKHNLFYLFVLIGSTLLAICAATDIHYNIADPECSGPFGLCTQEDKDILGYLAIKKLHAKMDEDSDGQVEVQETKEFMKEELQYKNGAVYSERQKKFHGNDLLISVDEMWKSWKYSQVYNWTTDSLVVWLNEQVKLPQYIENFKRNRIDGQFLPRLAINENNYYSNVMQIKDARHRRLLMIKATDLILFGQQHKPHNLIKDVLMISALTMSIFVCIYLYTKHRQSLEQIKKMLVEFEKLSDIQDGTVVNQIKNNLSCNASLFSFNLRKNSEPENVLNPLIKNDSCQSFTRQTKRKESLLMSEKNAKLTKELSIVKQEADHLRKARESTDGQLAQLKLAEQELEKVRNALKQTETRLELIRYQPPVNLINLLNRTFDSEKDLLEYKFKLIDKEKEACVDSLKKVCKRQSGLLGALKIAHSSTLEDIQHKLEILTRELKKLNAEKHELHKRWNNIFDLCNKTENYAINGTAASSFDNGSQDLPNTEQINDEQSQETNIVKPIPQSMSFTTIASAMNGSKPKLVQNKYSVDNFYELESENINTSVANNNINSKIDDTNNNNIGLANLNDNSAQVSNKIIQQPVLKSPSFVVKMNPIQNHNNDNMNSNNNNTITNIVTTPRTQKIARESLIHKNDVFQFDDVESVKTSDLFFKSSPQSSFESDDTCKSSLNLNSNPNNKLNKKNKDLTSSFKKKNGFFGPLTTVSSTKMKKSVTSAKIENGATGGEPQVRLERSNTFTRHLSSLRRIFVSKQNIKASSQTNLTANDVIANQIVETKNEVKASIQSIPVIINNSSNISQKQLTISVNNKTNNDSNDSITMNNENLMSNGLQNIDVISIPFSNSNTSFTIRSRSNDNVNDISSINQSKKTEKKSKIFNLKFGKNKKNKTKN